MIHELWKKLHEHSNKTIIATFSRTHTSFELCSTVVEPSAGETSIIRAFDVEITKAGNLLRSAIHWRLAFAEPFFEAEAEPSKCGSAWVTFTKQPFSPKATVNGKRNLVRERENPFAEQALDKQALRTVELHNFTLQ